ncbi:HupE/UreJ family protein [Luteolibacter luteus]|uniref:HupE/UreJ family protein n=1 Tax=Luteolibacter luteus TaxID=2728835 RepID=A0A858RQQ7_9BACT|nr:HupE/UreJ family protein [Luteolibacter luteus]QJE98718.1 HupE/UreJ family protein [Luteolibacter luteus]
MVSSRKLPSLTFLVILLSSGIASAHSEAGSAGGFVSGFTHPLSGLDHMAAMIGVGLWGAFLGSRAMWLLPVIFPIVMAVGGALGVANVPLPGVETGIALSAVGLGTMVAAAARPPLWVAAVLVGVFAIFHGHAHGTELPESSNALSFAIGMVIATGLLHLCGIALGLLVKFSWGKMVVRGAGAAIAGLGFCFLFGVL